MRRILATELGIVAGCAALAAACSSPGHGSAGPRDAAVDSAAFDAGPEGGADSPSAADSIDDSPDDEAPALPPVSPYALVRVANWSPGAPPVDVCLAPHGTSQFMQPLVAGLLASDADGGTLGEAGASGLPFPLVTTYVTVAPGAYDVRVVAGGSPRCDSPVVPDTTTPSLAQGVGTLIALVGEPATSGTSAVGATTLKVVTFTDEITDIGGNFMLRFINASPSLPTAALGGGSLLLASFAPIFAAVPFGQVGPPVEDGMALAAVDQDGYYPQSPYANMVLSVHAVGSTTDAVVTQPFSCAGGIPVTMVAIGGGASAAPVSLLECLDSAGVVGPLSACDVLP